MTPRAGLTAQALIGSVRAYQTVVRPLTGCNCRFYPSCSDYGISALRTHGAWRGSVMAARRVLRCNPWVAGGYDPVPDSAVPPHANGC